MDNFVLDFSQDLESPTGLYIPVDIEDCIRELNKILPKQFIDEFLSIAENELSKYHFGLGSNLRNNWGLWKQNSRLNQYFTQFGIVSADDMSSIILACFWDILNGKPANLSRQIVYNRLGRDEIQSGPKAGN